MGDRELCGAVRGLTAELDPAAVVGTPPPGRGGARRVTLRPAPDVMAQLGVLLSVKDGVAV